MRRTNRTRPAEEGGAQATSGGGRRAGCVDEDAVYGQRVIYLALARSRRKRRRILPEGLFGTSLISTTPPRSFLWFATRLPSQSWMRLLSAACSSGVLLSRSSA